MSPKHSTISTKTKLKVIFIIEYKDLYKIKWGRVKNFWQNIADSGTNLRYLFFALKRCLTILTGTT
jgi:hypothetical protein